MTAALLFPLLLVAQDSPVKIRLASDSGYALGSEVTGTVEVARDGHLLVLRSNGRGRVSVIYPSRPAADGHVAAGQRLTVTAPLRQPGSSELLLAVWSDRPFETGPFTANTFWSTDLLNQSADHGTEAGLLAIARTMAGGGSIAYDMAAYALLSTPPSSVVSWFDPNFSRPNYGRYYSPTEFYVRYRGADGAPPDVCNASGCALSVIRQIAGNRRRY